MKKKWLKISLVIIGVFAALLMLSACDAELSTMLSIDKDFKGSRVMETNYLEDKNGVKTVISDIEKSTPEALTVKTDEKDGSYKLTFTLDFANKDEYISKVESLIGRKPNVTMDYTTGGVSPSLKLEEDFSSQDLLAWIKNVKNGDQIKLKHTNVTVLLDGNTYNSSRASDGQIVINSVSTGTLLFDRIDVQTGIMGSDDFVRKISFTMPKETYEKLGEARFKSLVVSDGDMTAGLKDTGKSKTVCYEMSFSGDAEYIARKTAEVFPGSTLKISDNSAANAAFSVNSVLEENINFSGYPCEKDGTANANVTYIQFGSTVFRNHTVSGNGVSGKDGTVKDEAVAQTEQTERDAYIIECKKAGSVGVNIDFASTYAMHDAAVDVSMKNTGVVTVDIIGSFAGPTANSALDHAYNYYTRLFKNHKNVEVLSSTDIADKQTIKTIQLRIKGIPEEINAEMNYSVGKANNFTTNNKGGFSATNLYNIHHNLDLSTMFRDSGYNGLLTYTFNCSGAYCKNVTAIVYDEKDVRQHQQNDMLEGSSKINSFTVTFTGCGGRVDLSYQASYVNVMFIIIMVLIGIGVVIVIVIGISIVAKRSKRIRRENAAVKEKRDMERSLTLAVIKNDDGSIVPLSNQVFENRPGAVIESKRDDGLDEDDDEPENVWLFSTTLKLLAVIAAVLTFFPFVTVSCSNLKGTKDLSAFTIMTGGGIEGVEPYSAAWMLLIIPLVIFLLLMLWNKLPKIINAIFVAGLSAINLFALIGLPDNIKDHITRSSTYQDKITSFSMNWAYSYSVIIYILLVLGSLMLILAEISEKVKKKFR